MTEKEIKEKVLKERFNNYNKQYTEGVVKGVKEIEGMRSRKKDLERLVREQEDEINKRLSLLELKLEKKTESFKDILSEVTNSFVNDVVIEKNTKIEEDLYFVDSTESIGIVVYHDKECIVYRVPLMNGKTLEIVTKTVAMVSQGDPVYSYGSSNRPIKKLKELPVDKMIKIKGNGLRNMLFADDTSTRKLAKGIIYEELKNRNNSK